MRIYVPPESGLGAPEISALRRLSRPSLEIIAEELHEPESREAVRWILQQRDPERALVGAIAETVQQATHAAMSDPGSGMGELGKSFFKKLTKIHRKVFKSARKVVTKVAHKDPLYKATSKIRKKVAAKIRPFVPIILTVVGAVLAPFTGGASMAAAALLATAYQLRAAKIQADKAKRAGKAEAGAMQAQVAQQEAEVTKQADDVYHQNQDVFLAAGYDESKWNALTLDQKIELINQASAGTLKPTAEAIAAQQQVTQTADDVVSSTVRRQTQGPSTSSGGSAYSQSYPQSSGNYPPEENPQEAPVPQYAPEPVGTQADAPAPASSGGSGLLWLLLAAGGGLALAAKKGK